MMAPAYWKYQKKIVLENYDDSYCKLLRDVIAYSGIDKEKYITKELFKKWYQGQVTSIPNAPVKYMDDRNSITFKLYKEDQYVTVIIYSNGLVNVLEADILFATVVRDNKVTAAYVNFILAINLLHSPYRYHEKYNNTE